MRAVRYGTALHSFVSPKIFIKFPNMEEFSIEEPTAEQKHSFRGVSAINAKRSTDDDGLPAGLPSVSLVNGCNIESQKALYWWQYRLVKEMGITEFRKFMLKNLHAGTKFHSAIHELLKSLKKGGKLPVLDDVFYAKYGGVNGFIDSIAAFLPTLQPHELMRMEEKVVSHRLGYQGKFDAIIDLNGTLTLVDWKTVNQYSAKSQREEAESALTLEELYSNPVQVAAYIGAVNAAYAYTGYPIIRQGAIVLAYEDGRTAEVVLMSEEEIEHHFQTHLQNLNYFWRSMATRRPDIAGNLNLVFNPHVDSSA